MKAKFKVKVDDLDHLGLNPLFEDRGKIGDAPSGLEEGKYIPNPYMKHLPMSLYLESDIKANLHTLRGNKSAINKSVILEEAGKTRRKEKKKKEKKASDKMSKMEAKILKK